MRSKIGIVAVLLSVLFTLFLVRGWDSLSLYTGTTYGTSCVPGNQGEVKMYGDTLVENEGSRAVRLSGISLEGNEGFRIIDAGLVPIIDQNLAGFGSWPEHSPENWTDKVEVEDAVIEPGEKLNLVLVLESKAQEVATSEHVRIHYKGSFGRTLHVDGVSGYVMTSIGCDEYFGWDDDEQ
ncbi:hypothetical protein [Alteribacter aurantiacus]|uniref:hypothetical protein n=1 Tax=Alteribacter aurantiacus TaxID=254410 RepID=UPI000479FF9D|nr:hypothetical protein [Alteribacter aurantiacus]